jgi:hypothetical protein
LALVVTAVLLPLPVQLVQILFLVHLQPLLAAGVVQQKVHRLLQVVQVEVVHITLVVGLLPALLVQQVKVTLVVLVGIVVERKQVAAAGDQVLLVVLVTHLLEVQAALEQFLCCPEHLQLTRVVVDQAA